MTTYILYDLLTSVRSQFETNLTTANGYRVEPIKVIMDKPNAINVMQLPLLGVFPILPTIYSSYCNGGEEEDKTIQFVSMGLTRSLEDMCNMYEDVLKFLHSEDFTYPVEVFDNEEASFNFEQITGQTNMWVFDQTFTIIYNQTF